MTSRRNSAELPDLLTSTVTTERGSSVVAFVGEVDGATSPLFRAHAMRAVEATEHPALVIDLGQVSFFGSSGAGALVEVLAFARECQVRARIVVLPGTRVMRAMAVMGLLGALPLFESRDAALTAP